MPSIARLGHVGIHCNDLAKQAAFYKDVLGLTETDRDDRFGMVFLSARPDDEHHELLLCGGRTAPEGTLMVQQISFRCDSLDDVVGYYERFKERGIAFDMIVTHGNAVAVYFYDPEGNRCEVYWNTGLKARQPFLESVDLTRPPEEILAKVREAVASYGETGYVDTSVLAAQNIEAVK